MSSDMSIHAYTFWLKMSSVFWNIFSPGDLLEIEHQAFDDGVRITSGWTAINREEMWNRLVLVIIVGQEMDFVQIGPLKTIDLMAIQCQGE